MRFGTEEKEWPRVNHVAERAVSAVSWWTLEVGVVMKGMILHWDGPASACVLHSWIWKVFKELSDALCLKASLAIYVYENSNAA